MAMSRPLKDSFQDLELDLDRFNIHDLDILDVYERDLDILDADDLEFYLETVKIDHKNQQC